MKEKEFHKGGELYSERERGGKERGLPLKNLKSRGSVSFKFFVGVVVRKKGGGAGFLFRSIGTSLGVPQD